MSTKLYDLVIFIYVTNKPLYIVFCIKTNTELVIAFLQDQ